MCSFRMLQRKSQLNRLCVAQIVEPIRFVRLVQRSATQLIHSANRAHESRTKSKENCPTQNEPSLRFRWSEECKWNKPNKTQQPQQQLNKLVHFTIIKIKNLLKKKPQTNLPPGRNSSTAV